MTLNERLDMILAFLSTGILRWQYQREKTGKFYPYPDELRIGMDKLAAYSLEKGISFPKNIKEIIQWFHEPLAYWEHFRGETCFGDFQGLLKDGLPTEICYELSVDGGDVEQELTQGLMLKVMGLCNGKEGSRDYVKFRRQLIEHPVLTVGKMMSWASNPNNGKAAELIQEAYEELPSSSVGPDDRYYQCRYCGWVLEWSKDRSTAYCHSTLCAKKTNYFRRVKILEEMPAVRVKRGILRYVTRPGRWELNLEKYLIKLGLEVEMWPNLDCYDLRITFPDGETWAVDVKDWENPYRLARKIGKVPDHPSWQKAFWVVPDYRGKPWPNYEQVFRDYGPKQENVIMLLEKKFRRRVEKKVEAGDKG